MTSSADPLVSTDWLATHLGDAGVRVLDASFKLPGATPLAHDDFLAAHIPGAVFFDVDAIADPATDLPHMYPDAAQFARDVAALGVSSGDTVVVYDSGSWMAAPRAWWMFLAFGPRVRQSARRRPEEMARRGARDRKWRRHVGAGRFHRDVRSGLRAQPPPDRGQSRLPRRAGDRRPQPRAVRGPRGRAATRLARRPYSRQPQRALWHLIDAATATMKSPAALRTAFETGRRRARPAAGHELRLRRLGRRADAGTLPPRRIRQRALRRFVGGMGPAGWPAAGHRPGLTDASRRTLAARGHAQPETP